jgi:hypothetical protein
MKGEKKMKIGDAIRMPKGYKHTWRIVTGFRKRRDEEAGLGEAAFVQTAVSREATMLEWRAAEQIYNARTPTTPHDHLVVASEDLAVALPDVEQADIDEFLALLGMTRLPDLTGSPKQIAWALDIRKKFLLNRPFGNRKLDFVRSILEHTEAKYFIDTRGGVLSS